MPIQLVIADDHEIYRAGLIQMLARHPDVKVVGEASDGKELIDVVALQRPNIVLVDINMPVMDGIEATRQLRLLYPTLPCIALSVFDEDAIIIEMLDAGACGYLMKNSAAREVIEAIKSVYQQQPYYCRQTSVKLAGIVRHSGPASLSGEGAARFTDREKEIIRRICMEASLDTIAEELYLSRRTIEGYRVKIMEKMRVKSTAGIVIYAIKYGIYSIE